jgi:hypothetical protein
MRPLDFERYPNITRPYQGHLISMNQFFIATEDDGLLVGDLNGSTSNNLPTGNHRFDLSSLLSLYPNPTSEQLHIRGETNHFKRYRIISINGQLVQEAPLKKEWLNIQTLPAGTYIFQAMGEGYLESIKFMVQ